MLTADAILKYLSNLEMIGQSIVELVTSVDATLRGENRQTESCEQPQSSLRTLASHGLATSLNRRPASIDGRDTHSGSAYTLR